MRSKVPGRSSWCALLTLGMGFQLLDGGGGVMVKSSSSQIRFPSLTQAVLLQDPWDSLAQTILVTPTIAPALTGLW